MELLLQPINIKVGPILPTPRLAQAELFTLFGDLSIDFVPTLFNIPETYLKWSPVDAESVYSAPKAWGNLV